MTPPQHTTKPLFRPLPPHVDPHDPRTIRWELDHVKEVVQDHHSRVTHIETRPSVPEVIVQSIPWARLVPVLLLLALFFAGVLSRQETKEIGMKLFGVLFGA